MIRSEKAIQRCTTTTCEVDRRSGTRHTMVLRVAIIDDGHQATFCLLRNISPGGVQIKAYSKLEVGKRVCLHVAEESPIFGQVAWFEDRMAGIHFDQALSPATLLRVEQKGKAGRRRTSPRIQTSSRAKLRTCGRVYRVELSDISTTGAKLRTPKKLPSSGSAILELPGLPPVSAYIRWSDDKDLGLSFSLPMPIEVIATWMGSSASLSSI